MKTGDQSADIFLDYLNDQSKPMFVLHRTQYPNKYYSTDIELRNAYRLYRKNKRDCSADVKGLLLQPLF